MNQETLIQQALKSFPNTSMGDWVPIDSGSIRHVSATVGNNCYFSNKAIIGPRCVIKDRVNMFGSVVVGPETNISGSVMIRAKEVKIIGRATIKDDVRICDNVFISGRSHISGKVKITDDVMIYGSAKISDNVSLCGESTVGDNARVCGNVKLSGHANVSGNAYVGGNATISGRSVIESNAQVFENASISGCAKITDNAKVFGKASISGAAFIMEQARVFENSQIKDNVTLLGKTMCFGSTLLHNECRFSQGYLPFTPPIANLTGIGLMFCPIPQLVQIRHHKINAAEFLSDYFHVLNNKFNCMKYSEIEVKRFCFLVKEYREKYHKWISKVTDRYKKTLPVSNY